MGTRRKVQTVEQTGKGIKFLLLVSFLAALGGCVGMFMGGEDKSPFILLGIGGFLSFMFFRFLQWWYHG
jgi:hypothetical protein